MREACILGPGTEHESPPPHPTLGEMKSPSQGNAGSNKNITLHPAAGAGRHTLGRTGLPSSCTCCDYSEGLSQGSGHCGWPWAWGDVVPPGDGPRNQAHCSPLDCVPGSATRAESCLGEHGGGAHQSRGRYPPPDSDETLRLRTK